LAGPCFDPQGPNMDSMPRLMTVSDVSRALLRAAAVVRRIVGVPDYERYVAHVRECHPGTTPMTRREFEAARLDDRYSKPGQRCC
jgi:uncharacterized short protein YbdD (DUF466 family)